MQLQPQQAQTPSCNYVHCDPLMVSASCRSPECLGQRTLLVQNAYHGPAVLRVALWEVLLLVDWRGNPGLALQVTLC